MIDIFLSAPFQVQPHMSYQKKFTNVIYILVIHTTDAPLSKASQCKSAVTGVCRFLGNEGCHTVVT